jgi:ATP-dependent Clp protease ATP-binding subunit ClpA
LLLCEALDRGVRLIGTTLPVYVSRFEAPPLARRTEVIELTEMTLSETRETLGALRQRISDHHHIEISEGLLDSVVDAALSMRGHLPAKAISLLDGAAARAVLAGDAELSAFDIWGAVSQEHEVYE